MKLDRNTFRLAFTGFQTVYNDAFEGAASVHETVAMRVNSTTGEEAYGWLGQFPGLREWLGERVVKTLAAAGYTIKNRDWESTVAVKRNDFEDDKLGIYRPMFSEMGRVAKQHPDQMLFDLLGRARAVIGYDGAPFFSRYHPIDGLPAFGQEVPTGGMDPAPTSENEPNPLEHVSNLQLGEGPTWYLLDLSRAIKPLIWQVRKDYVIESVDDPNNIHVFMKNEFLFGVWARVNAGLGLWQLAHASRAELNTENYVKARNAMTAIRGNEGRLLGITPTHLVVPSSLEARARTLLKAELVAGNTNIWKDTAELIVTPYLN